MSGRSYARIVWSHNRLSVHLVNPEGEQFTMFAEPFLRLLQKPDECALVKKMDKHPQRARGYHGGEIVAQIDSEGKDWLLTLYFSTLTQRMTLINKTTVDDYLVRQQFILPQDEIASFKSSLEIMLEQGKSFDKFKMNADATPEWEFAKPKGKN